VAVAAVFGLVGGVSAQEAPLEFTQTGDAVPGGSVMVSVATTDGSTISSVAWSQTYGVDATLSGADTAMVTAMLGAESDYKDHLIHVLEEPPIGPDQLPPNVPPPSEEFYGGLQNRFVVVGASPFALEEGGLVELHVMVTTDSGSYETEYAIHTTLRWKVTAGISNVPIGVPVLMHGKEQASYDWAMTTPGGSASALMDAMGQNPEFTPDVVGMYSVTVMDEEAMEAVNLTIYAGTWRGIIDGEDAAGNPTVDGCDSCHANTVADWAKTGHAEIFKNTLNTNTHYGESCFACHTVGFDPDVDNGGIDEASDYQAFLDSGLINSGDPTAYAQVLANFPETARHSNIQCENCHGPQDGDAHRKGVEVRGGISSDSCATCHGEPLRHARFQQWQLSKHANYEVAVEEGQSGTCSKCHTGNGFLAWLPVLIGTEEGDINDPVEVTWTEDETHPQTCVTCHNPHAAGDVSGNDNNATVWISGDTPELLAGFTATDVGRGAICMTCHNTRRGLRNDSNWDETTDRDRGPHLGAQTDMLMGENVYLTEVGQRGYHSQLEDSCATCHMEATDPPPDLAYNLGGTNHTFYASNDICAECHTLITAEEIQGPTEMALTEIHHQLNEAWEAQISAAVAAGNSVDLNGDATIDEASDLEMVDFTEYHGRQALVVTLSDSMEYGPYSLGSIDVVPADGEPYAITTVAPDNLLKSGWNYSMVGSDGSLGVHNPSFTEEVLETTEEALAEIIGGGGFGGSANAVACTSDFVYWTEIAARLGGSQGSVWRTDLVAKNGADVMASLTFYLHADSPLFEYPATVDAGAQGVFEDVVEMMGADGNKGAMEICSDRPLEVVARIYNVSDDGTFGQFVDGINYSGMDDGDTGRLYALRQMTGQFRTNISVTNTGMESAVVTVTLFGTNASELTSYDLTVGSGMTVQDLEPFRTRESSPDLGWGYAFVDVTSGEGVITSASVIDSRTNDATTIPMKY
jgi:Cytochrome c554 and c-prime